MSSIAAPDIFRDTLDEYSRSAELNNQAQQLRQQQAAQQQQNQIAQGQLANQTAAQGNQNKLAPEVLQQQQLENQQKQIALQQQQALIGAQKGNLKKDSSGKIIGFDNAGFSNDALAAGVPLGVVTAQQQAMTEAQTKAADLTADQLKNHETELDQHFDKIEALRKIPSGPQRELSYQSMIHQDSVAGKDISDYPTTIGDDSNVDQLEAHLGMTKQALNQAKEQSEIFKNNQGTPEMRELNSYLTAPDVPNESLPADQRTPASFEAWKLKQSPLAGVLVDQLKQANNATSLDSITNTTGAGRKYIKAEDIPKAAEPLMKKQAAEAGIPVVNKDTAAALSEIDTAKTNQDYMMNVIGKKLASGAPERLWYGPANTIEKMAQTDPELAAVGTFRNAAIQSMRAVAGSKGLRINQYEVQMAIDNDIPNMTDTLPVAKEKLNNLKQFLEDSEASNLDRNRQQNKPAPIGGGSFSVKAPNGKTYNFQDQQSLDNFKTEAGIK